MTATDSDSLRFGGDIIVVEDSDPELEAAAELEPTVSTDAEMALDSVDAPHAPSVAETLREPGTHDGSEWSSASSMTMDGDDERMDQVCLQLARPRLREKPSAGLRHADALLGDHDKEAPAGLRHDDALLGDDDQEVPAVDDDLLDDGGDDHHDDDFIDEEVWESADDFLARTAVWVCPRFCPLFTKVEMVCGQRACLGCLREAILLD